MTLKIGGSFYEVQDEPSEDGEGLRIPVFVPQGLPTRIVIWAESPDAEVIFVAEDILGE